MPRLKPTIADEKLAVLFKLYKRKGRPVSVNFRDLLPAANLKNRATHGLHAYPARLLANIPAFFLSSNEFCPPGGVVVDPFSGSGTVLLEAVLSGRLAIGADSNPLARLISSTKATPVEPARLKRAAQRLAERIPEEGPRKLPDVINLEHWFLPRVARDLSRILVGINSLRSPDVRRFFYTSLSACIKEVSLADPRLSVPVRLRSNPYRRDHWLHDATQERIRWLRRLDTVRVFFERLNKNIEMMELFWSSLPAGELIGLCDDARALTLNGKRQPIHSRSVDLVITSPPYVGAQKYIRASSLSLTWLGLCDRSGLRPLETKNIGREHYRHSEYDDRLVATGVASADRLLRDVWKENKLRAHIAGNYLKEMAAALEEIARVLKVGGHLVLVVGEGTVCQRRFRTPAYLTELAEKAGLRQTLSLVDPIRSRALMTKRNHTAGMISAESVIVFRRR